MSGEHFLENFYFVWLCWVLPHGLSHGLWDQRSPRGSSLSHCTLNHWSPSRLWGSIFDNFWQNASAPLYRGRRSVASYTQAYWPSQATYLNKIADLRKRLWMKFSPKFGLVWSRKFPATEQVLLVTEISYSLWTNGPSDSILAFSKDCCFRPVPSWNMEKLTDSCPFHRSITWNSTSVMETSPPTPAPPRPSPPGLWTTELDCEWKLSPLVVSLLMGKSGVKVCDQSWLQGLNPRPDDHSSASINGLNCDHTP